MRASERSIATPFPDPARIACARHVQGEVSIGIGTSVAVVMFDDMTTCPDEIDVSSDIAGTPNLTIAQGTFLGKWHLLD